MQIYLLFIIHNVADFVHIMETVLLTFIKKYTIILNSIFNLWGNYYAKTVMGRSQGY